MDKVTKKPPPTNAELNKQLRSLRAANTKLKKQLEAQQQPVDEEGELAILKNAKLFKDWRFYLGVVVLGMLCVFLFRNGCGSTYTRSGAVNDSLAVVAAQQQVIDSIQRGKNVSDSGFLEAKRIAEEAEEERLEIQTRYTDLLNSSQSYLTKRKQVYDADKDAIRKADMRGLDSIARRIIWARKNAKP